MVQAFSGTAAQTSDVLKTSDVSLLGGFEYAPMELLFSIPRCLIRLSSTSSTTDTHTRSLSVVEMPANMLLDFDKLSVRGH
jgi:hypothetical protein